MNYCRGYLSVIWIFITRRYLVLGVNLNHPCGTNTVQEISWAQKRLNKPPRKDMTYGGALWFYTFYIWYRRLWSIGHKPNTQKYYINLVFEVKHLEDLIRYVEEQY
jgi:hypothetical protein